MQAAGATATHEPGRRAVVTGAGRGIGRAVTEGLLEAGFRVAATDRDASTLESFAAKARGAPVLPLVMDVADRASVEQIAEEVAVAWGGVDLLVNNAGIFEQTPALTMDDAAMVRLVQVNLCGTLRCTAAFGRVMARQRRGRIVNIASVSGITGAALASVYAASKAGVIAATRSAARELAAAGITVTAIAPGYCDTDMLAPHKALVDRFVVPRIPLERVARPDEIAEWVVFLATCAADYHTGGVFPLDGGISSG